MLDLMQTELREVETNYRPGDAGDLVEDTIDNVFRLQQDGYEGRDVATITGLAKVTIAPLKTTYEVPITPLSRDGHQVRNVSIQGHLARVNSANSGWGTDRGLINTENILRARRDGLASFLILESLGVTLPSLGEFSDAARASTPSGMVYSALRPGMIYEHVTAFQQLPQESAHSPS